MSHGSAHGSSDSIEQRIIHGTRTDTITTVNGHQKRRKSWHFTLAFTALAAVAFASALDATILSIALPTIAKDLHGTALQSFWSGISFLLTTVLFQPIHTILSDIFGRKLVLYICIGFFGVGSIVVACAKSMEILILGRTVQGIGGGGLEALSEIILTDLTTLKERPLYIGIMGFIWAAGAVLGPIVGGAFAEYVSWRWIGWINLPILGIAVVLVPPFLTLNQSRQSFRTKLGRIDYVGMALFMVGLTSFILPVTWGGTLYPWKSWRTLFPLLLGIAILIIFVGYESRPAEPVIPLRFFKNPTSGFALLCATLHGIILWCVLFYLPLFFQEVKEYTPLRSAVETLPLSFSVVTLAVVTAFAVELTRRYRWTIWGGWIFTAVGIGLMSLFRYQSSKPLIVGLQVIGGIGMGTLFPALAIPIQAAAGKDDAGLVTGIFVFFRALGSVIGVALGSSVFSNQFAEQLQSLDLPTDVLLAVSSLSVDFVQRLETLQISEQLKAEILMGYAEGLRWVWVTLACIAAVGFLASLFIRGLTIEKTEVGRQAFQEKADPTSPSEDQAVSV